MPRVHISLAQIRVAEPCLFSASLQLHETFVCRAPYLPRLRLRSSGLHGLFWPSTKLAGRKRFVCATKVRFAGLSRAARQALPRTWLYGSGKCSFGRLG